MLLLLILGTFFGMVSGYFKIQHVKSGDCLGFDSPRFDPPNGSRAIMVSCQDAPTFYYDKDTYRLQKVDTNKCLDGYKNPVVAYACGDWAGDQQWLATPVIGWNHADYVMLSNGGNEGQLDDQGTTGFQLETGDVRNDAKWFIIPHDEILEPFAE